LVLVVNTVDSPTTTDPSEETHVALV